MNIVNVYCIQTIGDEEWFRMDIIDVYCIQTIGDEEWFRMNIVNVHFMRDNFRWGSDFVWLG